MNSGRNARARARSLIDIKYLCTGSSYENEHECSEAPLRFYNLLYFTSVLCRGTAVIYCLVCVLGNNRIIGVQCCRRVVVVVVQEALNTSMNVSPRRSYNDRLKHTIIV